MDSLEERVDDLARELQATREFPVERDASRWIGEAEAVATDLTRGDPNVDTVARRVGHVAELLDNVEETGHADADEHVRAAESLAADILAALE